MKKFKFDSEAVNLIHTPSYISQEGCSYCLKVKTGEKAMEIVRVSQEYGIKLKGVYKQISESEFEKIRIPGDK